MVSQPPTSTLPLGPTRLAIEGAIATRVSNAGWFEELAGDYIRTRYPAHFPYLIRKGQRSDRVTHAGWPDAFARRPSESIDAIEATGAGTWNGTRKHLKEDLASVEGSRHLRSFSFVSWCPEPSERIRKSWRARFIEAGIPTDELHLVFREELVDDLTSPRYSSLWVKHLGLPISPDPFLQVERAGARLFGNVSAPTGFAPSSDEYRTGSVWLPPTADDVRDQLEEAGWALVLGPPHCGKTVLATALCLERAAAHEHGASALRPAFYLDLSRTPDPSRMKEVMAAYVGDETLLVFDNAHRDEELAAEAFGFWCGLPNAGQALFLARELHPGPAVHGRDRGLAPLLSRAIRLRVASADFNGVYERLRNRPGLVDRLPLTSLRVSGEWAEAFAGDLLAFAAATAYAAQRAGSQSGPDPTDAASQVTSTYIDDLDQYELSELGVVSALEALELDTPSVVLGSQPLRSSLKRGTVYALPEDVPPQRYRLNPRGMGDLVLTALDANTNGVEFLETVAAKDMVLGFRICSRLRRVGRSDAEGRILRLLVSTPEALAAAAGTYRQGIHVLLLRLERAGLGKAASFDAQLAPRVVNVAPMLTRAPGPLTAFLRKGNEIAPASLSALLVALREPEAWTGLLENLADMRFEQLGALLDRLKHSDAQAHQVLVALLVEVDVSASACRLATEGRSLQVLAGCIAALGRDCPSLATKLEEAMLERLPQERLRRTLENSKPLEAARFGKAIAGAAPRLAQLFDRDLEDEALVTRLAEMAVRQNTTELVRSLEITSNHYGQLHKALLGQLAVAPRAPLLQRLCDAGLSFLARAIKQLDRDAPELAGQLLSALDRQPYASLLMIDCLALPDSSRASQLHSFVGCRLPTVASSLAGHASGGVDEVASFVLRGEPVVREYATRRLRGTDAWPRVEVGLIEQVDDGTLAREIARSDPLNAITLIAVAEGGLPTDRRTLLFGLLEGNWRTISRRLRSAEVADTLAYLRHVRQRMPQLHRSLSQDLWGHRWQRRLGDWVKTAPVGEVGRLCRGGQTPMSRAILKSPGRQTLATRLTSAPLAEVLEFLHSTEFARRVLADTSIEVWNRQRSQAATPPELVPEVCRQFDRCGRPELGEVVAKRTVDIASDAWAASGASAAETSHVLRLARDLSVDQLLSFLQVNGGDEWLRKLYARASLDELTGHLYGVWIHQDRAVCDFLAAALDAGTISRRMEQARQGRRELGRIRLLGALALAGVPSEVPSFKWPTARALRSLTNAVELPGSRGFLWNHSTMLLGLRELAHVHPEPLQIDAQIGSSLRRALERRYKTAAAGQDYQPSYRRTDLLRVMGDWLQECEDASWTLVADTGESVRDLGHRVFGRLPLAGDVIPPRPVAKA